MTHTLMALARLKYSFCKNGNTFDTEGNMNFLRPEIVFKTLCD